MFKVVKDPFSGIPEEVFAGLQFEVIEIRNSVFTNEQNQSQIGWPS